ncbi:MAG: DegT/DnrJ/EryC1/StrS family aminotransferase, partial [Methanoculleus sp.]
MLARFGSYLNIEEIVDCIHSDRVLDEDTIREFERKFAHYIGAPRCFATNQARAGLLIALKSLPISPGDEVIVQSFTFQGVIDAILDAGGQPVLIDNSPADLNADVGAIEKSVTEKT